jgi:putative ABC transport system permease protein
MLGFLLKGLIRDRSRSLFPVLTVLVGVALTVFMYAYLTGFISDMLRSTAHYNTGHVRVMTRAYAQEAAQSPNDLALIGLDSTRQILHRNFPEMLWTPRIKFGGLLDVPDRNGETRMQAPVSGFAIDLLSPDSPERRFFNFAEALERGRLPEKSGEVLIAETFAQRLKVAPGDTVTLISSTMYGSMTTANFVIAGTVRFGIAALDRGAMFADLGDVQYALDMNDAAGEILGFFPDDNFHEETAYRMVMQFNRQYSDADDPFSPVMGALPEESGLKDYLALANQAAGIIIAIFLLAMSIVLWNAGLMNSIRRYGEIGVRLAIGEDKGHIYRMLILEAVAIGIVGSVCGTLLGLIPAYYMQYYGLDLSFMFDKASLMISGVLHARVTAETYFIGFVPGILSTVLGTAIAGIGIYKRQTATLFKELEA